MNLCRKTVNFMNIALIESDILWGDPKANLARNASAISCLLDKGAVAENDLVLLPECFSTGYAMTPELVEPEEGSAALEWLLKTAADNKIALFTSLAVEKDGKYYNRGYFVLPEGRVAAVYDKRHLFMGDEKPEILVVKFDSVHTANVKNCFELFKNSWNNVFLD